MTLLERSLVYYWRTGILVSCGVAVATAVITGALVVGDSVRGSVRDKALARLGDIESALVAPSFFRLSLAGSESAALVLTRGAATNPDTGAAAPNVNVIGCAGRFPALFAKHMSLVPGEAALNATTAADLGLVPGDALLLSVAPPGAAPADSLFARRKGITRTLRMTVRAVLPDDGIGGFGLDASTLPRRNVFVAREWLAGIIGKSGRANAIVTSWAIPELAAKMQPSDVGLRIVPSQRGYVSIESEGMVLSQTHVTAALRAAKQLGFRAEVSSVSLATTIRDTRSGRAIAYAVACGSAELTGDQATMNQWAATDLGATTGDGIMLEHMVPSRDGSYATATRHFTVARVADMSTADPRLVPSFEGITNATRITDWDPPFPVDLNRVTPRDEEYWTRYRAAPKVFVAMDAVRAMWPGPEWVTSVRVFGASPPAVEQALMRDLVPAESGMAFRPVRQQAIEASEGSSDFSGLLLGMGAFLVLAGVGLATAQMRLMLERRSFQAGVMLATGFTRPAARRPLLEEGLVLGVVGAAAGGVLGVLYAMLMLRGLSSSWSGAVGGFLLILHVEPSSIAYGVVVGFVVGAVSVWWAVWRLTRMPVLALLSGSLGTTRSMTGGRRWRRWLAGALVLGALALGGAGTLQAIPTQGAFFGVGASLLAAGLLIADLVLSRATAPGKPSLRMLAARNARSNRRHSLVVVGLLACASFILVTVAASTRGIGQADVSQRDSGAGGFSLVATSSLPIPYDFGTPKGRAKLGFPPEDEAAFQGVRVIGFLATSGEDASCLNMARPTAPRVLGVPREMIDGGGFTILPGGREPWRRLAKPAGSSIPAFADEETATWILHTGLGETFSLPNGPKLRFAGLIASSIFASDLLVSEDNFRRAFPGNTSPRYFLIETPPGRENAVAVALRRNLGPIGLDVRSTRSVLSALVGVQNAYLSTFLALGGLGLLLATVGLATTLLRNAMERRKELALLLAIGLRRADLARMMLYEHGGLLVAGIALGAFSALVAISPHLLSSQAAVDWPALAGVLAAIAAVGLGSAALAAAYSVRGRLLAALRSE